MGINNIHLFLKGFYGFSLKKVVILTPKGKIKRKMVIKRYKECEDCKRINKYEVWVCPKCVKLEVEGLKEYNKSKGVKK